MADGNYHNGDHLAVHRASLAAQLVKNLPAVREAWVPSLGGKDPLVLLLLLLSRFSRVQLCVTP